MESKRYRRLYVSNARSRSGSRELQDLFADVGKVVSVVVEDGEGYIEYAHDRDAEEALRKLDGTRFGGSKLNVEYAVKSMNKKDYRSDNRRDRDGRDERRDRYDRDDRRDRRDRGDRRDVKCYNCNEMGHIARDCDKKPQDNRRRRRSRSPESREYRRRDNRDRDRRRRDDSEEDNRPRRNNKRDESASPRNDDRAHRDANRNGNGNHNAEEERKEHTDTVGNNNHANPQETVEAQRED